MSTHFLFSTLSQILWKKGLLKEKSHNSRFSLTISTILYPSQGESNVAFWRWLCNAWDQSSWILHNLNEHNLSTSTLSGLARRRFPHSIQYQWINSSYLVGRLCALSKPLPMRMILFIIWEISIIAHLRKVGMYKISTYILPARLLWVSFRVLSLKMIPKR